MNLILPRIWLVQGAADLLHTSAAAWGCCTVLNCVSRAAAVCTTHPHALGSCDHAWCMQHGATLVCQEHRHRVLTEYVGYALEALRRVYGVFCLQHGACCHARAKPSATPRLDSKEGADLRSVGIAALLDMRAMPDLYCQAALAYVSRLMIINQHTASGTIITVAHAS
jgi:hypothetical protein